ncbi:MAG TPA: tRNA (adenosine(37)-N6)-dimethylallyltransferase MiaA [Chitinophagales bacterium]|nr:tRNA (adenosine(37)-N6)-dimethylallyltransferase MiaA [Chitinophagales bacterium]
MKKFLIIIAGPTAVGKTSISIRVAKHFHTEIISADARQFYREMNIGTAKPTIEKLSLVSHHFINHLSIHDDYSAGKFEQEALELMSSLFLHHDVLVMVGGSGLFIKAVLEGFDSIPPADDAAEEKIKQLFKDEGISALQKLLLENDPVYYGRVDINNPHRLIRALVVNLSTGKPFSSFRKSKPHMRDFISVKIGLHADRKELYDRINHRVDEMIQNGLLEEAKELFPHRNLIALQTVGYRELFDFLEGKISFEKAVDLIKQNTRNYAKRQMTWFRKEKDMQWFSAEQAEEIMAHAKQEMLNYTDPQPATHNVQ